MYLQCVLYDIHSLVVEPQLIRWIIISLLIVAIVGVVCITTLYNCLYMYLYHITDLKDP